jgi:hypothetical protein
MNLARVTISLFVGGTLRNGFSITRLLARSALVIGVATAIPATWAQDSPDALAPGAFGTRAGAPIQRVASPDNASTRAGRNWGLPC